jgi:formate dehydrogenase iron-sulfur subunit
MSAMAILTDVTKCIGCEECVSACKKTNSTGEDRPWRWQRSIDDLSASRWTAVARLPQDRFVRRQCRHCLDPACVSACPVGALHQTAEGAVVYDSEICMGCRYCMMSCPFGIPRYLWSEAVPYVRKCVFCYDKIQSGELRQPACTEACLLKPSSALAISMSWAIAGSVSRSSFNLGSAATAWRAQGLQWPGSWPARLTRRRARLRASA